MRDEKGSGIGDQKRRDEGWGMRDERRRIGGYAQALGSYLIPHTSSLIPTQKTI